jgi:uncharacterized LabA/DUF88 family protein
VSTTTLNRVSVYVDGFNLYFGLKKSGLNRCLWLDIRALAQGALLPGQVLVDVKYFTARTSGPLPLDSPAEAQDRKDKLVRQCIYLDALKAHGGVQVIEGHYDSQPKNCKACGAPYYRHEEKRTDVNIATEMLVDAYSNKFDVAILISADSDLVPPIEAISSLFLGAKSVVAYFPPKRRSKRIIQCCAGHVDINRSTLAHCQLPDPVPDGKGGQIRKPNTWV